MKNHWQPTFYPILLALLFLAGPLPSQSLSAGARFDFAAAKWTFEPTDFIDIEGEWKSRWLTSFVVGFPVEVRLHDRFAVQAEINLARRGFAISNHEQDGLFNINSRADFIIKYTDLPLLAKVFLNPGDKEWYLLAGPSWSKARSAKIKATVCVSQIGNTDEDCESESEPFDLDDIPRTKKDFGLHVGLGWVRNFPGGGGIFFEGRYYHGLRRLSEEGAEEDVYNRGGQVSLGFLVPIIKRK